MAIRTGLGSYVGAVAETTFGTVVTPTRFLEFLNESIEPRIERIESTGIRAGSRVARTRRWRRNDKGAAGSINFEIANKGFGLWLKHALGAANITTPGGATLTRLHTHVMGDKDDLSLTVQKVVPDVGGTNRPFTFAGVVVTGWEIGLAIDGLATLAVTLDGQKWETSTAAAVAAFPSSDELYGYQDAAISVAGSAINCTGITLRHSDPMATERYYLRSVGTKGRPLVNGMAEIGGELTMEFEDMTQANRFLTGAPGDEVAVLAELTGSTIESGFSHELNVNMPKVRFDGGMVAVQGPEIVTVTAPFKAMDDLSAEPVTIEYQTTDTAS